MRAGDTAMTGNVTAIALDEEEPGPFVLNLCSIPAPISIPQPRSRNLVKYAFFVSRGTEGGRECFWLHMGYFASRDEALKWQTVLQRIYPLAFVTSASMTFTGSPRSIQ
jgi:hypothetical protein